ncbi:sugar ABC transporter ATP-binding protein [Bacillus sp. SA1-12]|uniref:carbohydrate ABC transporter permease n=1 Tax=Bacillus sp. SA1-12 TaxID=1455638 RepID=UPI000627179C|nr:carbohydrate ABC transporter permease [Bacillus sp. SA1-12]KKI89751.1 sugar ABC transporter ATP-binding protein [Bacillus sp. SA1-12]
MAREVTPQQVPASTPLLERKTRKKIKDLPTKIFSFIILFFISILMLGPLFIMLSTALKDQTTVFLFPPKWIPETLQWGNFKEALTFKPFNLYFWNTTVYSVVGTLAEVLSSAVVAYGFSRYKGKGRNILFLAVLATMMIPYPVVMIPQFVLFKTLNWTDSYLPLIVPSLFGSAYIIFLLRQFFNTLPKDLFEAGRIDGCGELRAFWSIALPLCKPALASAAIFGFMFRWNDYLGPLIYLNSETKYTLSIALSSFTSQFTIPPWHLLMAASLIAVLPPLLLFFFAQKYFVEGIVVTGIK